jgi:glycosyltransferase involved in cell wall biosynthesis
MNEEAPECKSSWMIVGATQGLVSIILPTYNRAWCLLECLDSIYGQSYRPLELVLVDDGSTDNTPELVQEWIALRTENDPKRFATKFIITNHQGAPAARNRGLRECSGEFIVFVDSDDLLAPDRIALQVDALSKFPLCDVSSCSYLRTRGEHCSWPPIITPPLETTRLSDGESLFVWTYLFRRRWIVENGPWNESLLKWQDAEYLMREGYMYYSTCVHIPLPLHCYREHSRERISSTHRASAARERLRTFRHIRQRIPYRNGYLRKKVGSLYASILPGTVRDGTLRELLLNVWWQVLLNPKGGITSCALLLLASLRLIRPNVHQSLESSRSAI